MSATSILAFLFVLSIIGIPVGLIFWCAAQIKKLGKSLADKYPGLSATYEHSKTTKGMIVSLACSGPRVVIHREGAFERFGKASGLSKEIQSNDAAFDRDFYIDTESHAVVKSWLQSSEVREAVVNLFRLGIKEIQCKYGYLTTRGPRLLKTLGVSGQQLEAIARNLALLSRELEKAASSTKPEPVVLGAAPQVDASRLQIPKSVTWIVSSIIVVPLLTGFLLAFINGQSFCIPIYGAGDYIINSWPYWSSSLLMFAVYLFPVVKGHSKAHESFLALLAVAGIAHIFAAFNIYEFINVTKDSSQSRVYQLNLLQAYDRRPEKGSAGSSVVRLSSIELGGADLDLTLPYSPGVWDIRLIKGAEITVNDGYLGIPYATEVVPIRREAQLY